MRNRKIANMSDSINQQIHSINEGEGKKKTIFE